MSYIAISAFFSFFFAFFASGRSDFARNHQVTSFGAGAPEPLRPPPAFPRFSNSGERPNLGEAPSREKNLCIQPPSISPPSIHHPSLLDRESALHRFLSCLPSLFSHTKPPKLALSSSCRARRFTPARAAPPRRGSRRRLLPPHPRHHPPQRASSRRPRDASCPGTSRASPSRTARFLVTSVFFWARGRRLCRRRPDGARALALFATRRSRLCACPAASTRASASSRCGTRCSSRCRTWSRLAPPRPVHPGAAADVCHHHLGHAVHRGSASTTSTASSTAKAPCTRARFHKHAPRSSRRPSASRRRAAPSPSTSSPTFHPQRPQYHARPAPPVPAVLHVFLLLEFGTICAHSGYSIPGLPSNLQHDFHHFAFDENFGPTGLLDAFHGINKKVCRDHGRGPRPHRRR